MEPFLGEIRAFAFSRVPNGWLPCDGRQLQIQPNVALFALLGIRYGGDGKTTFNLPDLRGRAPIGAGQGTGLSNRVLADMGGAETHTLTINEMPRHDHKYTRNQGRGTWLANGSDTLKNTEDGYTSYSGGDQPHNNMSPYLVLNFIIKY